MKLIALIWEYTIFFTRLILIGGIILLYFWKSWKLEDPRYMIMTIIVLLKGIKDLLIEISD